VSTLKCGQNFLFETFDNGKTFYGPLENRYIKIWQEENPHRIFVDSNQPKGLEEAINTFLRRSDAYIDIQKQVMIDPLMEEVVQRTNGLHLVLQPQFECTIAFFLSQCSNIPRITHHLHQLQEEFGEKIKWDGHQFYLFPTVDQLAHVSEEQLRELGFGYRAKYIHKFLHKIPACFEEPPDNSESLNCVLQEVEGIGQKVADCIQLLAFGDLRVFPVDVWIQRFMQEHYFKGEKTTIKQIRKKGQDLFGKYAGYANQWIYHYIRLTSGAVK
jgi:N-glycosylase/DNA lyase